MKKELFALLLLLALFAGAMCNVRHLHALTDELGGLVDASAAAAAREDWNGAASAAQRAFDRWLTADGYTHVFVRHAEIDSATDAFCALLGAAQSADSAGFGGAYLTLRTHLSSIYGMERLTFGSIF